MDEDAHEMFEGRPLSLTVPARHMRPPAEDLEGALLAPVSAGLEERLLGPTGAPRGHQVHALTEQVRREVQAEAQLLASLEIAGISAAPSILEIEDSGYVRETAPPMRPRGAPGSHRAEGAGEPPTGERRAQARAREALDALIDELHRRGWVLGAAPGAGLGVRADGTVVVLDLQGLRPDEGSAHRLADRRWVDSVLQDADRTLRRRVHLAGSGGVAGALVLGDPPPPLEEAPAIRSEDAPSIAVQEERARSAADAAADPAGRSLPVPRGRRRTRRPPKGRLLAGRAAETLRPRLRSGRAAITWTAQQGATVVREPRLRRIALGAGSLVLVGIIFAILGFAGTLGELRPAPAAAPAAAHPDATEQTPAAAPRIDDAQALAAELAGARHSYLIGLSAHPPSVGAALLEDQRIRDAYTGLTVSGGGPVIHSAEVLGQADGEGEAVLLAVASMEQVDLEDAEGETTVVPGTEPVSVRMSIRWDGEKWQILEVSPEPPHAGDGAA